MSHLSYSGADFINTMMTTHMVQKMWYSDIVTITLLMAKILLWEKAVCRWFKPEICKRNLFLQSFFIHMKLPNPHYLLTRFSPIKDHFCHMNKDNKMSAIGSKGSAKIIFSIPFSKKIATTLSSKIDFVEFMYGIM